MSIGAGSSILNYASLPLAQSLGHFKQEGLTVTIENFQAGGRKALQALIGGSVDAVVGFYDHTIQMQAQGKDIVGVFLLTAVPGVVFDLRADLAGTVKEGKDLKGLKLGTTARNPEGAQATFGGPYPTACLYTTSAFLRTVRWMAAVPPEAIEDALPAASKVDDASLNLDIVKASKAMFSQTGRFDAEAIKTPLAVLSSYDEKSAKAPIDLARTYTNRFAEEAARRSKGPSRSWRRSTTTDRRCPWPNCPSGPASTSAPSSA